MAGSRDSTETVVATTGDVWIAPVGSTAPTDADTAPAAEWYKVGYISEDGVTFSHAPTIEEFPAWQSRQPIRREAVGTVDSISFALEQWNAETVTLAFGGGSVTQTAPNEYRYDFPSDNDSLDERAIIVDFQDGSQFLGRYYFQRGSVTEAVETQLTRSALALLPVTYSVLAPSGGGSPGSFFGVGAAFHS